MKRLKALATVALLATTFFASPQAAGAQDLSLDPLSWDFGEVPLGTAVAHSFTGTSIGSSEVSIYLIQIRPDTTGVVCGEDVPCDFAVTSVPDLQLVMPPGAQTFVEVTFIPSAIGSAEAFLYLRSDDSYPPPGSIAYIPLAGVGVENPADLPIPARVYLNKPGGKTKLVSKGTFALPDPITDDPVNEGAAVTFTEGVASETILLPSSNWTALGNPPGSKGFRYKDSSGATCRKVLVKDRVIKALCKETGPGAPPFDSGSDPAISVVLSIGTPPRRYCAECPNGGAQEGNPASRTKLTDCLAPVTCPPSTGVGVCCDFPTGCASAPSAIACLETAGGTTVGGGAVCDASGDCVTPPGSPGDCCEGSVPYPLCTMVVDQTTCEGGGGTFHTSTICAPSGACRP